MGIERIREQVFNQEVEKGLTDIAARLYGRTLAELDDAQAYNCVLHLTKEFTQAAKHLKGDKKVYLEYGDKFVYASDGRRKLELDTIPSSDKIAYIDELMFGLIESIDF